MKRSFYLIGIAVLLCVVLIAATACGDFFSTLLGNRSTEAGEQTSDEDLVEDEEDSDKSGKSGSGSKSSSSGSTTSDTYFMYELLDDDTYAISVKKRSKPSNGVEIPASYEGKAVTIIAEQGFDGCSEITSITIPSSVRIIEQNAFRRCSALATIFYGGDLAGWCEIDGVDELMGSGLDEKDLYIGTKVEGQLMIPDGVVSIPDRAFCGCAGLTSVSIPASVTSIGYDAFLGCSDVSTVYYGGDLVKWCGLSGVEHLMENSSTEKTLYINGKKLDGALVIPSGVTRLEFAAFYGCTALTSVTIPAGVSFGGEGSSPFAYCSGLRTVTLEAGVTELGWNSFRSCTGLRSITIPASVRQFDWNVFVSCTALTSIIFHGTMAQWNAITKGFSWNSSTGDYTIYCTDGNLSKE